MAALNNGLRNNSSFTFSLLKRPTLDMADLLRRAERYVIAEEEMAARRQKTPWSDHQEERAGHSRNVPGKKEKRRERSDLTKEHLWHKLSRREGATQGGAPAPTYNHFAPLLDTRTRILAVEQDKVPIQWPEKLRSLAKRRNVEKYCRYHREHGHDTEECRQLKNQIEDLIRRGHLRKYVDRETPQGRREQRREEAPHRGEEPQQKPRGVIHTISGGVASGGDHKNARKAYGRQSLVVQQVHHSKRLRTDGEEEAISFSEADYEGVRLPHNDPVVVTLMVELFTTKRILIDSGSSADILYKHAFDQLKIPVDQLKPVKTPLVGFAGEMVNPLGSIDLSVVADTAPRQTQVQMTFLVVDRPSPYNAIIGRPGLNMMEAIVSTRHLLMKFPTRFGVGEARGDQQAARQCYKTAIADRGKEKVLLITNVELRGDVEPERPSPVEDVVQVPLEVDNSERVFQVGSHLGEADQGELITFLRDNKDVFAWSAEEVPGISPSVMTHRLSVDPTRPPTRQKKRNFAPERQ
ncbi:hypothetical protein CFOL_v3_20484 [Cephalotus follicularis]|uniref:Uncharacterized protein n=1 Tax=Cephalotus follicularis TaxID=3775 RepID=A0A1Q3CA58_CEPFO|nr:hypothetical protein CFOL_v3_20484 [Cephalotus follicularis]